jgi:enoyl-CoA hydratase
MPEYNYVQMKKDAEPFIKFEKDVKNRIAYITFDRPEAQNSTTLGMRQNYADLIHKCNVDDEVKVVVIRGFRQRGRSSRAKRHAGKPRYATAA